jgi:phosphoribosylglycinamide formyltransferase 1
MKNIAIFASGLGTNAQSIIEYYREDDDIAVALIASNKPNAGVLEIAKKNNIPTKVFTRKEFYDSQEVLNELEALEIDFIVLAGFLWLIPKYLVKKFPKKIINIHPALLPKYGGKGMYGMRAMKAALDKKDKETGITIHYVNEEYDKGEIITQVKCPIEKEESPLTLAKKIQKLEHQHYPKVIDKILKTR